MIKTKLLTAILLVVCSSIANAQTATNMVVLDTRNVNSPPSDYSQEARFEFKERSVIGVPGLGGYSGLLTIAPWVPDNTGNKHHQLNFNDGGIYYRTALSGNYPWDSWRKILIENEDGNVGIGTTNPSEKLQIGSYNNTENYKINIPGVYNFEQIRLGQYGNGACGLELVNHTSTIPSYGVRLLANTDNRINGLQIQTAPQANSYNELNYKTQMAITTDGNVGIGTTNPSEKLTIAGNHGDTKLRLYSTGNGSDQPANLSLWASEPGWTYYGTGIGYNVNGSPYYGRIDKNRGSSYVRFLPGETKFEFQSTDGDQINALTIKENGNVGIGTTNPAYKLDVLGTIRAKEVLVNLDGGADFVFEKGYKLLPIEHVANYVQENKHLPDIPSANEMVKNGVSMGELQVKLLQKVEELTLYAIQQDKSKKELEAKLTKQESQYNALLEKVEMLTKQIEKK